MDTMINIVGAERMTLLRSARPTNPTRLLLAPCPDQVSVPGVRLQGLAGAMGEMTGQQTGWSYGTGVGVGYDATDAARDHRVKDHNSIKFSTRQGSSCSPPV